MFDAFTRQAYRAGVSREDPMVENFSSLPRDTLQKLAFGALECGEGNKTWLERFQGTELFEQALALMQEELHQEAAELQHRQESQQFYSAGDQLRLKKKLLELELARLQMGSSQPKPGELSEQDVPTAGPPGPQGMATQSSLTPEPGAPPKTASVEDVAPVALLRMLQKQAGIGPAVLNFASKHPGLIGGAVLGAGLGGVRGAQESIDPMTGQPVGGGVTGALTGALGGGVAGGVGGLAAQGLVRSGLGAHKAVQEAAAKGMTAPGGYLGQMGSQVLGRAGLFARDVGSLGRAGANAARGAGEFMSDKRREFNKYLDLVHPSKAIPTPPPAAS